MAVAVVVIVIGIVIVMLAGLLCVVVPPGLGDVVLAELAILVGLRVYVLG